MKKPNRILRPKRICACLVILTISTAVHGEFGRDSSTYQKTGPVIGTWSGTLFDKPLELSLWASPTWENRLTGAMIWGSCKTGAQIELVSPSVYRRYKLSLPDEEIYELLFSFGSLSEDFINSRAEMLNTKERLDFGSNNCPEFGYPGYSREHKLYFISDPAYSTLTAYIQKTNQGTLQEEPGKLTRSAPTETMNGVIEKLSVLTDYELEYSSAIAVRDPGSNYLEVAEDNRFNPNLVYKTRDYWLNRVPSMQTYLSRGDAQLAIVDSIKNTFDGEFGAREPNIYNRRLTYRAYVRAYGARCRDHLQEPLQVTEELREVDSYGTVTWAPGPDVFVVEKRFYDRYRSYRSLEVEYATKMSMRVALSGRPISDIMDIASLHPDTVSELLSNIPCDSATMRQLNENMWRSAHGEPSLQKIRGAIAGAEEETEVELLREQE